MSDKKDLSQIARDINDGTIFSTLNIPPGQVSNNLASIFLPIMFGGAPKFEVGLVYAYMKESLPRGANGFPSFGIAYFLTVDEADEVREKLTKLKNVKL